MHLPWDKTKEIDTLTLRELDGLMTDEPDSYVHSLAHCPELDKRLVVLGEAPRFVAKHNKNEPPLELVVEQQANATPNGVQALAPLPLVTPVAVGKHDEIYLTVRSIEMMLAALLTRI